MTPDQTFRAFRIHDDADGYRAGVEVLTAGALSAGEVLVKAAYSSVNYKDALAGTGSGKILRRFPLNGGIDVSGTVVESSDPRFKPGDAVLCTGSGLSETRDGGFAEMVRLPADSTIALPDGLDLREAMVLGTAGFTAALALYRMQQNDQRPDMGPILITGASGGVGTLAIDIFSRAGFQVHAVTGKPEHAAFLAALGATRVIERRSLDLGSRPLEKATWAGALDNVGGQMLAGLARVIEPYGNIASCGMAGGSEVATTVMPFIIRGVSLLGIASAGTARPIRETVWRNLAGRWKPAHLASIATREVRLEELSDVFPTMLSGGSFGRTVVKM